MNITAEEVFYEEGTHCSSCGGKWIVWGFQIAVPYQTLNLCGKCSDDLLFKLGSALQDSSWEGEGEGEND